jgi:hypothetical protein
MTISDASPSTPMSAVDDPDEASSSSGVSATGPVRAAYAPFVQSYSAYTATVQDASRIAWRVTIASGLILLTLLVGGPIVRSWYVGWAIELRGATMRSIDSVVFVQRQGVGDWVVAQTNEDLDEGDVIRTAVNARAFMQFFDGSTALIFPDSTFRIIRSQQGRFQPDRYSLILEVVKGRARIGVAPAEDPLQAFVQLRAPSTQVHVTEGSYSIDASGDQSQVTTRRGVATGYSNGAVASALTGQRLVATSNRPPIGGLPSRRDLVINPVFADRDGDTPADWAERDISEQDPPGEVTYHPTAGTITLARRGQGHGETMIAQNIDVDLWDFERVDVEASVRVLSHSLSGGGWQGTEYPLILRVIYRDITGTVHTWYRGFYRHNDDNFPVRDAELLPSSDWVRFETSLLGIAPRPWRIIRVELVASGWDYASVVNAFHIWAD